MLEGCFVVADPYSTMIRLLAVKLAKGGLFDNFVREKVDTMRDSDPEIIRQALTGMIALNDVERN